MITPIEKINSIAGLDGAGKVSSSGTSAGVPFQDLFQDAVQNVKTTNADLNQELYKLTTGQTDDLHNVAIASTKATLSVQMLVQLRNKALDAYNEIMRISV
ncbi:flagellar hook-basal body complex protein FliE [Caproiciproducens faecalis]|uniref:Flagellar hook-basal body complex protein FliE n=1 Tax=Caproiciproducens faecalis TaxID=2820301 RepID=A0ABS7DQK2_9FIRM|nr:flagellar hook-basal body complex protein FliE [Caproiciproducens faecalis]MBW7573347.1 flagellar hook-basal body complex protein FliE [Caproiciproducens faecalis]